MAPRLESRSVIREEVARVHAATSPADPCGAPAEPDALPLPADMALPRSTLGHRPPADAPATVAAQLPVHLFDETEEGLCA